MALCCYCNGKNAVCKRCACVHAEMPCTLCLPLKLHCCGNILASHTGLAANSGMVGTNGNSVIVDSDGARVADVFSASMASARTNNDSSPQLISQQKTDDLTGYGSRNTPAPDINEKFSEPLELHCYIQRVTVTMIPGVSCD